MRRRRGVAGAVLIAALLALAPVAGAEPPRDLSVRSFDGTLLRATFSPGREARPGDPKPTVLLARPWGGRRNEEGLDAGPFRVLTVRELTNAGYNVLTWDARGWYDSRGRCELDSPAYEGRDVSALIDAVAGQPEALLQRRGDPVVGMHGASYGANIELIAAARDHRIDAIAPSSSAYSMVRSVQPNGAFKTAWGEQLLGLASGANLDPAILGALSAGVADGRMSSPASALLRRRSPGRLLARVRAPTLLLQGTVDTLFPLQEAIDTYTTLRRHDVPVAMRWYCGGHGVCPPFRATSHEPSADWTQQAVLGWFDRYLRASPVAHYPRFARFAWVMDDGSARAAVDDWPLPPGGALAGGARGPLALTLSPRDRAGGSLLTMLPAPHAIDVPVATFPRPGQTGGDVVGAPTLSFAYRARTLHPTRTWLYAQIVDMDSRHVLGDQVTPIPIAVDGAEHSLRLRLGVLAVRVRPASRYVLQVTDASPQFHAPRVLGRVTVSRVVVRLPLVDVPHAPEASTG